MRSQTLLFSCLDIREDATCRACGSLGACFAVRWGSLYLVKVYGSSVVVFRRWMDDAIVVVGSDYACLLLLRHIDSLLAGIACLLGHVVVKRGILF